MSASEPHQNHADHDDFGGLQRDLAATASARLLSGPRVSRRNVVRALGLFGSATLAGCGSDSSPTSPSASTTTTTTDASLRGLTVSSGAISPAFSAAVTTYAASVGNGVVSTTVTAASTSATATIKINGTTVASGVSSGDVALALGANTITVAVTAADGQTTRTYSVVVSRSTTVASSCTRTPNETEGPYPADGSNGPNVLTTSGIVRSDVRASFGGLTGAADGVPLTIGLTIVSASTCEPLAGRAVYLWHCTRGGSYSLYSSDVANQNYLRGVQETDANGQVSFVSIFPGCYAGRWPHIHFEVYPSVAVATRGANKQATSQIALPKAACDQVYATSGYESSVRNLNQVTLASDNVFSDGATLELATMSGSVGGGLTATLSVAV